MENSFENRSLLSAQRQEPPGRVEPKSILKNAAAIFMTVGHNSGDPDVIRIYWDESVWCLLPIYSQFEQPRYDQVTVSICCQSALRCLSGYFLLPSGSDKKDVYHCFFALREDKTTRRHVREMKGTKATTHTGVRRKKKQTQTFEEHTRKSERLWWGFHPVRWGQSWIFSLTHTRRQSILFVFV